MMGFLRRCVSVSLCHARLWLLKNAERFCIRPSLLFTVFLGFTKDPYPYVRRVSLDGLVSLSKSGVFEDRSLVEGCFRRAVELLGDMEDCVRSAAVRVVCSWGLMVVAASKPDMKTYWSNEVFAKLCSMARDMSMEVRLEAFNALGMMEMVSEDILLQSLSKKVIGTAKQKGKFGQYSVEQFEMLAKSAAGALVHGLEDEFLEVRKSACQSLHTLIMQSAKFAGEALNFLMDVLNDDSLVVRLQALETMHHMAVCDSLKVQETHMHMFLGVLADNSMAVRYAARKVLKLIKLKDLELFKLSINSLLENSGLYPQDEADLFSVFSHIGRNHGKFVAFIIKEIFDEIEAAFEGTLAFDSVRVTALLILSISAPLTQECVYSIPPIMFSYAVTLLGRIASAFSDIMDRDAFLAYLSEHSKSTRSATNINYEEGEPHFPVVETNAPCYTIKEIIGSVGTLSHKTDEGPSEIPSNTMREQRDVVTSHADQHKVVQDKVLKSINNILAKVKDVWPLVHSGFTNELLRILRCWKEELASMTVDSYGTAGALAFTLHYIRIMKLLAKVWELFFLPAKRLCSLGTGEFDFMLGKLDRRVRELRSRFVGFSVEEELNVLELILVTCVLRLCKVEICCHIQTFKKLTTTISHVESLLKKESSGPSNFVVEVRKLLCESGTSMNGASCSPFLFETCLKLFSLKQFVLSGRIRHIDAELNIPDNDAENPLPFVSGLPVGIPFEITLHNILGGNKLWLSLTMDDDSTQYVFLDLNLFEEFGEARKFASIAPFYKTPKANSFILRACISLEYLFENVDPVKRFGGPKHDLTYLCPEKEVYLAKASKS
ncbi:protein SIEL [Quillaja saponaria]|uniref:Protein SIEL n=1 Tax=Quillaja saponaria TaxID=32244 RepID=A0AAD7PCR0_QUISA|nr:protein SIEL [Quillaja saponaria]